MNNMFKKNYGYRNIAGVVVSNDTFETGLNNHDMVLAKTGGGKTGIYVSSYMEEAFESLVVVDTKGILYRMYKEHLLSQGIKVKLIDMVKPENSTCGFNPLAFTKVRGTRGYSQKELKSVVAALVPMSLDEKDKYWVLSARKYLYAICCYVMEFLEAKDQNLGSVLAIHKEFCSDTMDEIFENASTKKPGSAFAGAYNQVKGLKVSDKTWACVMDFASTALDIMDSDEMKIIFSKKKNISFEELGREKTVLFINISDIDRCFDGIVNLLYLQGIKSLVESADGNPDGRLYMPVRFIFDDFACGAPIDNFDNIISVVRSRDISCSLIVQSLTQLNTVYGTDRATTIINACDHLLYLSGNDDVTKDFIAYRLNKPRHIVDRLPSDKAYLLEAGSAPRLIYKPKPYALYNRIMAEKELQ
ncbi:MAG: type IV secretory system conjugative DNA transfer family protein [Lachnospiraceae bacterium]|nr:type IV secretory system conjugative DNA transfer family protein [Lachnospiraceae bacterium]